jgi:hypothetical protein
MGTHRFSQPGPCVHKLLATVLTTMALCSQTIGNAHSFRPSIANIRDAVRMKLATGLQPTAIAMRLRGAGDEEQDSDDSMPTIKRTGNAHGLSAQNRSRNVNIVFIGHVDSGIHLVEFFVCRRSTFVAMGMV